MNKKVLILPIIGSFLLTGCKINLFGKTIYLFEKPSPKEVVIDEVTPSDAHKHATSLSYSTGSPSAPFYLKVGETRKISVTLSPSPDLDSEKTISWSVDKTGLANYSVDESDSRKVTIEGVKQGEVKLTATNDYNKLLTYTFTIKVIDFNEDNQYLWQYASSDRAEFGYDSQTAKQGTLEGNAVLGGMTWHYTRSNLSSLQSSMGSVGFGKGKAPETHLHFESENTRIVEKFTIEAASAKSLAKMTIKVGDTIYMDEKTVPADRYDEIQTIFSDEVTPVEGKIEIDVYTPEYESEKATDPDYDEPGAFYLKSILINFEEGPEDVSCETFDFKEMYDTADDGIFDNLSSSTAKSETISQNDIVVSIDKVKKEATSNEKIPGYAHCNSYIDIVLNRSDEVISGIEYKFTYGEATSKNVYSLNKSKSGGAPFSTTGISSNENGLLKAKIFDLHCNALRLTTQNSYNVGLEYLSIKTKAGVNPTIEQIVVPEVFEPTKKQYVVGQVFDVTGLPNLSIKYEQDGIEPDVLTPNDLEWFDGPSYSTSPQKELQAGTTYVVGVFRGNVVVEVTGLTVEDYKLQLTMVNNVSDLHASDKVYIISPANKVFAKGSSGNNVKTTSGVVSLDVSEVGASLELSAQFKDDYFTVGAGTDGKLSFQSTTNHYLCITDSGALGANGSASAAKREFAVTIDAETGIATIHISVVKDENTLERNLNYDGSKFALADAESNVAIYKLG